ncbi:hypothetical protein MRB53_039671 [Persea americana]|nr:hypothetical protein MRB53_039671 [Persea americana]
MLLLYRGRMLGAPKVAGLGKNIYGQDYRRLYSIRKLIDKRWENGEAAAIYLNGHKDSVYCVQFDEDKIITGSRDNTIRIWDARSYRCIGKLGPPNNPRERNHIIRGDCEPTGVVPFFKMDVQSIEPAIRSKPPSLWHQASVLCLQYDDDLLVTGSSDFTAIVWSIKHGYKPIFRLTGHKAGILDVALDSKRIITCSKDTTIKIWNRKTGALIPACVSKNSTLANEALHVSNSSEDGRTIFAGGNDHVVYEYDTTTANVKRELRGHSELVRSLHLDSANGRIVSGSYDHSIKVWNSKTGSSDEDGGLMLNLGGLTSSWMLAAKSNYRKIACASQDGRVVIIDFGFGINGVELVEA